MNFLTSNYAKIQGTNIVAQHNSDYTFIGYWWPDLSEPVSPSEGDCYLPAETGAPSSSGWGSITVSENTLVVYSGGTWVTEEVSASSLSLFSDTDNYFKKSSAVAGAYVSAAGYYISSGGSTYASGYIPVTAGTTVYFFSGTDPLATNYELRNSSYSRTGGGSNVSSVLIPSGVSFIRTTVVDPDLFMMLTYDNPSEYIEGAFDISLEVDQPINFRAKDIKTALNDTESKDLIKGNLQDTEKWIKGSNLIGSASSNIFDSSGINMDTAIQSNTGAMYTQVGWVTAYQKVTPLQQYYFTIGRFPTQATKFSLAQYYNDDGNPILVDGSRESIVYESDNSFIVPETYGGQVVAYAAFASTNETVFDEYVEFRVGTPPVNSYDIPEFKPSGVSLSQDQYYIKDDLMRDLYRPLQNKKVLLVGDRYNRSSYICQ